MDVKIVLTLYLELIEPIFLLECFTCQKQKSSEYVDIHVDDLDEVLI
jgi:hypothetical protein